MHVYGEMLTNQRASEVSRVTYVALFVYPVASVQRQPDITQNYKTPKPGNFWMQLYYNAKSYHAVQRQAITCNNCVILSCKAH